MIDELIVTGSHMALFIYACTYIILNVHTIDNGCINEIKKTIITLTNLINKHT